MPWCADWLGSQWRRFVMGIGARLAQDVLSRCPSMSRVNDPVPPPCPCGPPEWLGCGKPLRPQVSKGVHKIKDIRSLARCHTAMAIGVLVNVAGKGESEAAKVAAAQALLDRGWGKPSQLIGSDPENPLPAQGIVNINASSPKG